MSDGRRWAGGAQFSCPIGWTLPDSDAIFGRAGYVGQLVRERIGTHGRKHNIDS